MRNREVIEYRGFGAGHLLLAALTGAVAGAVAAYLTAPARGDETRRRLLSGLDDARGDARRVPVALRRATEAAVDAFNAALAASGDAA